MLKRIIPKTIRLAVLTGTLLISVGNKEFCEAQDPETKNPAFVSDGRRMGEIVVHPGATTLINNIAIELATYVRKISNVEVPVRTGLPNPQYPTIVLLEYRCLPKELADKIPEPPEGGYVEKRIANTFYLAGLTPRTLQFAVSADRCQNNSQIRFSEKMRLLPV